MAKARYVSLLLSIGMAGGFLASSRSHRGMADDSPWKEEMSPWLTDFDAARESAQRSGKPLFVLFR
ncbi:MAG: hypothetical protein HY318_20700 [Armatimonadetes bacterium]|nr:hypothetical protein [Armatimonadota bacterium]